ncbi:hypothetical protein MCOR27_004854 [Pyricularia oryzae]|uniref:Ubiquitin-like protease family profile domain-containing protein n=2 Tax=Pyricularia TaxID=48558 RepID=A0ABQ8NK64_PYRGI|nr:hypothetical protein MCOR01_004517 [Pyricularia oryzae]KAI6298297.1 hypothetical protein MCOR33_005575 [Pyricularia grisea]KAH9431202.1 hypothetical protein MCOR02_008505 [Pyricularia oryzae]KAI6258132.1 hypothetical protein MCOR19_005456 [Pyricularia oryzae]KAI6280026.1 hypothetical protein MCOR27_004854 [Pyricularia oryzae]
MPPESRRKRRASCLAADNQVVQAVPGAFVEVVRGDFSHALAPANSTASATAAMPTVAPATPSVAETVPTVIEPTDPTPTPAEQQPRGGILRWISGFITPVYSFIRRRNNSETDTTTSIPEAEPRVKRRKLEEATFAVAWATIPSTRIGIENIEKVRGFIKRIKRHADEPYVTIAHYNFPGPIEAFSSQKTYDKAFKLHLTMYDKLEGYDAADVVLPEIFKPQTELLKSRDIIHGDFPDTNHVLSADVHDWMIHKYKENTWRNFNAAKAEFAAVLDQAIKSLQFMYCEQSFSNVKGLVGHPLESYDIDIDERRKHGIAADVFEFLGQKMEKSRLLRELVKAPAEAMFSVAADCRALEETKPVPSHVVFEAATVVPHSFRRRQEAQDQPQSWTVHMPADRMGSFDENPTVALRDKYLRDHRRTFAPSPLVPLSKLPHQPHRRELQQPFNVNRVPNSSLQLPATRGRLYGNRPPNLNQPYSIHRPVYNLPRRPLSLPEHIAAASNPPPHVNPLRRLEIKRPQLGGRGGILKRVAPVSYGPTGHRVQFHDQFEEIDFFTGQPITAGRRTIRTTARTPATPRPVTKRPNTPRPAEVTAATDFNWQGHFAVPDDTDSESDDDSEPLVIQTPTKARPAVVSSLQPAQVAQKEQSYKSTYQLSAPLAQAVQEEQPAFNWAGHFAVPDDSDSDSDSEDEPAEPIEFDEPTIKHHHQISSPTTSQTNVVGEPPVRYAEEVVAQSQVTLPPIMTSHSPIMDPVGSSPSSQKRQHAATISTRNASASSPLRHITDTEEPKKSSVSDSSIHPHKTSVMSELTTTKPIKAKSRYIQSLGRGLTSRNIAAAPRPTKRRGAAIRALLNAKPDNAKTDSPMPGSFPEADMEVDENETTESPQRPRFRQPTISTTESRSASTAYYSPLDPEKVPKGEQLSQSPRSDHKTLTAEERRRDLLDFFDKDYTKEIDPNGFLLESDLSSKLTGKSRLLLSQSDSSDSSSSSESTYRSVSPIHQSSESELQPSFGRLKISNFKDHQLALEAQIGEELEQHAVREEKERLAREAEKEQKRLEAEEAERLRREEQAVLARTGGLRPPRAIMIGGISNEWYHRIMDTMKARDNQILGKSGEGNGIEAHSFKTVVNPTAWLDDEIINGALSHLARFINERAGIKDVRAQTPKCVLLNSHFYSNVSRSKGLGDTNRWMRRLGVRPDNLLSVETFVIPINLGNNHWTLAVVRPLKGEVAHIDSMGLSGSGQRAVTDMLMTWLRTFLGNRFDERHWKTRNFVSPVQTNGHDCGVHTITSGMCIALGIDPSSYKPADMPLQRLRLAGVLMNNGFHGVFDLSKL